MVSFLFGAAATAAPKAYLAGPMFNVGEKAEMAQLSKSLEDKDFEVFLPQRDGMDVDGILPELLNSLHIEADRANELLLASIDALDIFQVATSDCIVMNLNGRVPDEGAVAELAVAWTLGKPGIIYHNDIRSFSAGTQNPLVMGRAEFQEVDKFEKVPLILRQKITAGGRAQSLSRRDLPSSVRKKISDGGKIWEALKKDRAQNWGKYRSWHNIGRVMVDLFGNGKIKAKPPPGAHDAPLDGSGYAGH